MIFTSTLCRGRFVARPFLHFVEAREIVRQQNLKSTPEWLNWSKKHRPANVPSNPNKYYAGSGWKDFADWMGYEPFYSSLSPKRLRATTKVSCTNLKSRKRSLSNLISCNTQKSFIEFVRRDRSDFEFLRMHPNQQANILFRKRSFVHEDLASDL